MAEPPLVLFVYGTLMRGQPGAALMQAARFLSVATTLPHYTLLDMGQWPALWGGGTTRVHGELYAVPAAALPSLDAYEDCPRAYRRVPVRIAHAEGVQSYVAQARGQWPAIASGVWSRPAGSGAAV